MFFYLLLLFTLVPVMELWLLLQIGQMTSTLFTISLIIVTGIIGAALAKHQGLENLRKLQTGMSSGQAPTDTLIDGLLILVAGAVLITPGVLTDLFGFSLLIPPLRSVIRNGLKKAFKKRTVVHFQNMLSFQEGAFNPNSSQDHASHQQADDNIIDVEYTSETLED